MNIQCGEKRREETVSSAVRATLAVDKAIPRLVFHLSYPSHKTLQRCLLSFFLFVLMCRLEGRIESSASECKRSAPWPMGTERTGSHIPRVKTGGGERNDGWITR